MTNEIWRIYTVECPQMNPRLPDWVRLTLGTNEGDDGGRQGWEQREQNIYICTERQTVTSRHERERKSNNMIMERETGRQRETDRYFEARERGESEERGRGRRDRHTDGYTSVYEKERERDRQTEKDTHAHTHTHTQRQAGRQTDRQIKTDRPRQRQNNIVRVIMQDCGGGGGIASEKKVIFTCQTWCDGFQVLFGEVDGRCCTQPVFLRDPSFPSSFTELFLPTTATTNVQ